MTFIFLFSIPETDVPVYSRDLLSTMGQAHWLFLGATKLFINAPFLHKIICFLVCVRMPERTFGYISSELEEFLFLLVHIIRCKLSFTLCFLAHLLCLVNRTPGGVQRTPEEGTSCTGAGWVVLRRPRAFSQWRHVCGLPSPLLPQHPKAAQILGTISIAATDICQISPLAK